MIFDHYHDRVYRFGLRVCRDGFDADDAFNKHGHFGLRGLRGRVKKLQGELTIRSALGEGAAIHVRVPLTDAKLVSHHAETQRA